MFKILKNLKKTWVSVLIIILLLCLQAWTDLTLPDYTSKIVNIGIQAGGIEYIAPEIIRKSQMDNILKFTQNDEIILSNYTLISKNNLSENEYDKYVKKYPELKNQDLYKLNKLNKKEKEDLDKAITQPVYMFFVANQQEGQMNKNVSNEQKQVTEQVQSQIALQAIKVEYIAVGVNTDDIQNSYIIKTGIQMIGIALVSMAAAVIIMLLSSKVAADLGRTLRDKVFKKVLQFTRKEFAEFSTASLITRSTNDIQQIQMLLTMLFRIVIYAPIIGIGGFIRVLTNSNNSMAWVIGLAIACIIAIVLILFIIAMPKFKKLQNLIDKLNLVSREILTGLPVIRAFNTEKREEQRFEYANKELMKANVFVNRAMSIMMPALMFIMNSVMLLIIWVGGHKVDEGIMQVGDMMAFIQYTMQIVISFLMISIISIMLPRASVSARRINEVLETEPSIKDKNVTKEFIKEKKGYVEFKNVSFRYPDADTEILEDITFTAKPGQTTALIGSTGSRKIYNSKFNTTFL